MKSSKIAVLAATSVLSLGALAGVAVAAKAGSAAPVKNSSSPVTAVDQSKTAEPAAELPDTDAVQEGSQTAVDHVATQRAEADTETAGTEAAEHDSAEAEEPDEANLPGGGHQDPDGQAVDHQFEGVE